MTFVKVCGMTRKEDVTAAVNLGASALGFILVAASPRSISIEEAVSLAKGISPFILRTAVLRNPSMDEIRAVEQCGVFDCIQFHGSEDPTFMAKSSLQTIKAFSVVEEADLEETRRYGDADFFLFDSKKRTYGTGRTFDHSLLHEWTFSRPFFLAGGLGPENLREALEHVRPFGVDLNSGVESTPGVKDRNKIAAAMTVIREFDDFERRQHP